jgi:hypothetical protein
MRLSLSSTLSCSRSVAVLCGDYVLNPYVLPSVIVTSTRSLPDTWNVTLSGKRPRLPSLIDDRAHSSVLSCVTLVLKDSTHRHRTDSSPKPAYRLSSGESAFSTSNWSVLFPQSSVRSCLTWNVTLSRGSSLSRIAGTRSTTRAHSGVSINQQKPLPSQRTAHRHRVDSSPANLRTVCRAADLLSPSN